MWWHAKDDMLVIMILHCMHPFRGETQYASLGSRIMSQRLLQAMIRRLNNHSIQSMTYKKMLSAMDIDEITIRSDSCDGLHWRPSPQQRLSWRTSPRRLVSSAIHHRHTYFVSSLRSELCRPHDASYYIPKKL